MRVSPPLQAPGLFLKNIEDLVANKGSITGQGGGNFQAAYEIIEKNLNKKKERHSKPICNAIVYCKSLLIKKGDIQMK